ncbi:hypothetical protein [Edaphobacter bradus]|uniref:hypothetical protein n=1 Tax=Edaphobacter bradus TaxID=2259016 RepID=UPI0021DF9451|nr:hypothetical protein [Edaphobacter bradus]
MKKILFTILQFLLFLIVFAVGSFLRPFHLRWGVTVTSGNATRFFVPDGLLLTLGVFLVIVVLQALRKRLCNTTWTVIAFLAAVAAGYALRLGFITRDIF